MSKEIRSFDSSRELIAPAGAMRLAVFELYLLSVGPAEAAALVLAALAGGLVASFQAMLRARSEPLDLAPSALRPLVPALGQLARDMVGVAAVVSAVGRAPPAGRIETTPAPTGQRRSQPGGARGLPSPSVTMSHG